MPAPSNRRERGVWIVAATAAAIVAVALCALLFWLASGDRSDHANTARASEADREAHDSDELAGATPVTPLSRAAVDAPLPNAELVDARASDATAAPATTPPPREVADLAARDQLLLRVVDERQRPIFDAAVMIQGLRKEGDEGSWFSRRDDVVPVRTDHEGRARIPYERWTDGDAKTVRVDLLVEHPDFISFTEDSFVLAPGEHVITLAQGSIVWVTVRHQGRVVPDARLTVEWEAQLGNDGWRREPDGRISTTRLAPGAHWITATFTDAALGTLASEFTPFELAANSQLDLELELLEPVTLRGKLDDSVPRPIVDGHVWVNLHANRDNRGLSSDHEAPVAADGTFEIEGLRRARGQIIALCDGWTSKLVPPRSLDEAHTRPGPNSTEADRARLLERVRAEERHAQSIDVDAGELVVVEMEPASELEVRVVDEHGAPLADVTVSAWPNVQWRGVGSTIFPWKDWNAVTDERGIARIGNLPPDEDLWFGASSPTHQLTKPHRDRNPSAKLESGKTTRFELALERTP
ncbi:MAG: carboxypeptidase-like regulatory domain-containing protein [Planctomycetes bacterium]|nr:carboxypeptidase-like regulatory domain-containing protein [Planctomycetota bacterium]